MKRLGTLIVSFLIFVSVVGCGNTQPISKYDFCLDTICTITVYDSDDESLLNDSFELIRKYERQLSATVEGSDIYNINNAGGEYIEVSEETAGLIREAVHISEVTGGAFDISIYPVSLLWDFKSGKALLPDEGALKEALSHVGYEKIEICGNKIRLKDPKARIELGAMAKGYIADKVSEMLKSRGVTSALINLGGNVAAVGKALDGTDFRVGIKKPFEETGEVLKILEIADESVATSGIDERYFELDGEIYHHILDTRTGYPARGGVDQVTVTAASAMDADILSTVLFIMGEDRGKEILGSKEFEGAKALYYNEGKDYVHAQ